MLAIMGSCASVHKDPKSAMKLRLVFASKNDKLVSPSPLKDKPIDNGDIKLPDPQLKPQRSPVVPVTSFSDYGSKEEAFFDSQAWLESDGDDDFFSVKGDFTPSLGNTPSRGNTPVHRGVLAGNRTPFVERPLASLPQSSPKHKRKNLLELFKESSRNRNPNEQYAEGNQNGLAADLQLPPKSTSSTPYAPVSSGKRTPNGELITEANSPRSAQCCLPRLRSGSFKERRKSMSPPAHSVS